MIQATVERMYTETEENRFLEVTYANGDKEVLYFKDFNSGAMIQNIVDRAKKMAIKDFLDHAAARAARLAPAPGVRRRVQGERGPAQHHQPRRLGADLRQEGRADRLHPHAHHRQAGHRARPLDRHRPQHRSVPLARPASRNFADALGLGLSAEPAARGGLTSRRRRRRARSSPHRAARLVQRLLERRRSRGSRQVTVSPRSSRPRPDHVGRPCQQAPARATSVTRHRWTPATRVARRSARSVDGALAAALDQPVPVPAARPAARGR